MVQVVLEADPDLGTLVRGDRQPGFAFDAFLGEVHVALVRPVHDLDIYPLVRSGLPCMENVRL